MNRINQNGFTLIEIAIVLLVVTILLGYTVALFPKQQELKHYRQANSEMDEIINQLIGFAQVNGRLPCPDTNAVVGAAVGVIDGLEDTNDVLNNLTGVIAPDGTLDSCLAYFGFLPRATIGINGKFDALGRLIDPWGQPYLYHVSNVNFASVATAAEIDLVSPNGVREEGMTNLTQNVALLSICNNSTALGADLTCAATGGGIVANNIAAVIVSTGKDTGQAATASTIQGENIDGLHNGTADIVYVSASKNEVLATYYDDVVKWISPNLLFSKMVEADQLP